MRLLLSNDDGYLAPGLTALRQALAGYEELDVVAPDRNRSASSSALTIESPLRAVEVEERLWKVDGTPSDCVHLAITGLLHQQPSMVVSGINLGANMGDDVWYSGTVAAAVEGRFLGLPGIAISLTSFEGRHFDSAGKAAAQLVARVAQSPLPADTILNVNVPDLPWEQIRGIRATRLGNRHMSEPVIEARDPRGRPIYWIGPAGAEADAGPGTDFHAVREGYISVTPLKVDLTRTEVMESLGQWLEELA